MLFWANTNGHDTVGLVVEEPTATGADALVDAIDLADERGARTIVGVSPHRFQVATATAASQIGLLRILSLELMTPTGKTFDPAEAHARHRETCARRERVESLLGGGGLLGANRMIAAQIATEDRQSTEARPKVQRRYRFPN